MVDHDDPCKENQEEGGKKVEGKKDKRKEERKEGKEGERKGKLEGGKGMREGIKEVEGKKDEMKEERQHWNSKTGKIRTLKGRVGSNEWHGGK
jgi:hypothetical protein